MDMVAFQEKMDPAHRTYFCRMLKMKVLPNCLLEQYARVKLLVDSMDAFLSVGDLAIIAIFAGFNPNTAQFEVTGQSVDEVVDRPIDEADDQVLEETLEKAEEAPVEGAYAPTDEAVQQGQVSGATGQAVGEVDATRETTGLPTAQKQEQPPEQPEVQPTAQQIGSGVPWAAGMPVNVLQDDELKQGKIVGVHPPEPGSEKPVRLTVEFEAGETVTVNEDEVEAD